MKTVVVLGLLFGDEGKGVVTDYLCSQDPENTVVVRFSGGQQATHTVYKDNIVHRFSQFGSGTLRGCPTYWSKYCTFDPAAFFVEYNLLRANGIKPVIRFHPDCPVTVPLDVFANRKLDMQNGTCGTGIYRTKQRHCKDKIKLTVGDLLLKHESAYLRVLDESRYYYNEFSDYTKETDAFIQGVQFMRGNCGIDLCTEINNPIKTVVFEGSQGLMLDEHIGYMPHCTPSDVTPRNALKLSGGRIDEIYLVVRAYTTRHGNGPILNSSLNLKYDLKLKNTQYETNKTNTFQGEFRTEVLDLEQLKHAKKEGIDKVVPKGTRVNLVVACTDQLEKFPLRVTQRKGIVYTTLDFFVTRIARELNINGSMFINNSPYSSTIRELKVQQLLGA
jgi:adenylosuccinate synthase